MMSVHTVLPRWESVPDPLAMENAMLLLRWTLAVGLFAGFLALGQVSSNPAFADEPAKAANKDKIVGVWEITKGGGDVPKDAAFEFTKDGKLIMTATVQGRKINIEGSYSVDGNQLKTVQTAPGGKKIEETDTIEKLTDTEMVLKDNKGKVVEFKKKK